MDSVSDDRKHANQEIISKHPLKTETMEISSDDPVVMNNKCSIMGQNNTCMYNTKPSLIINGETRLFPPPISSLQLFGEGEGKPFVYYELEKDNDDGCCRFTEKKIYIPRHSASCLRRNCRLKVRLARMRAREKQHQRQLLDDQETVHPHPDDESDDEEEESDDHSDHEYTDGHQSEKPNDNNGEASSSSSKY